MEVNYPGVIVRGAIILVPIIRGQFFWGSLFGGNYPGAIILVGNYPGGNCPGDNCLWGNYPGGNSPRTIFERANLSDFGTWTFTAKEGLIPRKQAFVLNLRL